jgi:hypothetical protein
MSKTMESFLLRNGADMFNKIIDALKNIRSHRAAFDPSRFNDPVAMITEWTPLKRGGSNFKTHKLVEINFQRVEFKPTIFTIFFSLIFFTAGIGIAMSFGINNLKQGPTFIRFEYLFPLLFGLVFASIGVFLFMFFSKPIVFDKTFGYFWKGRKEPAQIYDQGRKKKSVLLSEIHALQIISEYVSTSKNSYRSYELNLVLSDGSRVNVIDHGKLESIRDDAQKLSAFLGVTIWDRLA